ncbi:MAG: hypothetical protein NTZ28_00240, partial [Nitrospirae bacterium]|nr:hypothetical protein [Nitrospirota bacterium]
SLGIGQYVGASYSRIMPATRVSLPAVAAAAVTVTLTHSAPTVVTTPASVTIPAGVQAVEVSPVGAAGGVDTIVAAALASGYAPDTLIVTVGLGRVNAAYDYWPASVRVGEILPVGGGHGLVLQDPAGQATVQAAVATIFALTPPGNFVFVDSTGNTISSITVPAANWVNIGDNGSGVLNLQGSSVFAPTSHCCVVCGGSGIRVPA